MTPVTRAVVALVAELGANPRFEGDGHGEVWRRDPSILYCDRLAPTARSPIHW
jgi:hypothetical protein